MSLYQCEKCGCMENTSKGHYHAASIIKWPPEFFGKKLCSACGPTDYPDGSGKTGFGTWHGRFKRVFLPKGMFVTNRVGNLQHRNGDKDVDKYALPQEDGT